MNLREGQKRISGPLETCVVQYRWANPTLSTAFDELNLTQRVKHERESIGRGRFSDVYKGVLEDSTEIAVKILRIPAYSQEAVGSYEVMLLCVFHEITQWVELHHVNVARILGYTLEEGNLGLVLPWCSQGNLVDHLQQAPGASKPDLMLDIAEGLQYLHNHVVPLVHGDLKGVNILIDQQGIALVSDFEISTQMNDLHRKMGLATNRDTPGTIPWMSPELLKDNQPTPASDMYAFGGVLLEVWCPGMYPYHYLQASEMLRLKSQGKVPERGRYPGMHKPDWLWALMKSCWKIEPAARPHVSHVVDVLYSEFKLSPRVSGSVAPRPPAPSNVPPGTLSKPNGFLSTGFDHIKKALDFSSLFPSKQDGKGTTRGQNKTGLPLHSTGASYVGRGYRTPFRFRILVIGKVNEGKLTLSQKLCSTTEAPITHNEYGIAIDPSIVSPTDRGSTHGVTNALIYSSNSTFVFHECPGFETSSTKGFNDIWEFIAQRTATCTLADQLHAIWYCLPLDSEKPLSDTEMAFFEESHGKVPTIAVFTNFEGLVLKEYNKLLLEGGTSDQVAKGLALQSAEDLFLHYLKCLQGTTHPPARCLRTQENDYTDLSMQTLEVLDSKTMQQLFVVVQQTNILLCTESATTQTILPALFHPYSEFINLKEMAARTLSHYPHLLENVRPLIDLASVLEPIFPTPGGQGTFPMQLLRVGAATLITAYDSFWLQKTGYSSHEALKLAFANYQTSARYSAVIKEVDECFGRLRDLSENRKEELVRIMMEIVQKFWAQV